MLFFLLIFVSTSPATPVQSTAEQQTIDVEPLLYATHIPTSCPEKALLAAGSAAMALYDPTRDGKQHSNIFCTLACCRSCASHYSSLVM